MISTKAVGRGEQKNEDSAKHLYSSDMMQLYLASEKNERSRKISSRKHCNRKQRHTSYLSFFTQAKFFENKIYAEKTRKLRQNTQKIANFLRYYGKYTVNCQFFALNL